MAGKRRTVAVRITADTKGLVAGVTKAELTLGNLRKTAVAGTAVLAKFAAVGGAAAAGALTALYARTAPLIDANAKLADRLNMSTIALAGMQLEAGLAGVSNELLSKSLDKMAVNIGRAAAEGGMYEEAITRIGLKTEDLLKMSADEQYKAIADGIASLGTAAEQAAAAQDIFGRGGVQMLNFIRGGSEAIDAATKRAQAYGTALTRVDAAKVEAANDAWDEAQQALQGIANRITVKLAPLVQAFSEMFSEAALESNGFGEAIDNAFSFGVKAAGFLADAIRGIHVVLKGGELAVFTLEAAVFEVFKAATDIIATSLEGWTGLFDLAIGKINQTFGKKFATIDFKAADSPFVKAVADISEISQNHILELASELEALAMKEMPSEQIERFVAKVQSESQKAAEAVATARKEMFSPEEDPEASARMQEDFEKFREMHLAREAAEIESLARSQAELKKFHDAGLVSTGNYWAKTAQMTTGMLANMTASVANHSKEAFDLNKKLGIANALINTYEMATAAYKALAGIPFVGPALGAAAAAAAIKFGQLQIDGIKSAKFGGGTAPSASNTPAPATTPVGGGGAPAAQRGAVLTVEGISEDQMFSGSVVRALASKLAEHQKDGGTVVFA